MATRCPPSVKRPQTPVSATSRAGVALHPASFGAPERGLLKPAHRVSNARARRATNLVDERFVKRHARDAYVHVWTVNRTGSHAPPVGSGRGWNYD